MLQIPLTAGLEEKIETTILSQNYTFTTKWNSRFGYYSMDIAIANTDIATGILLVAGVDVAFKSSIPLKRVYCVNKKDMYKDFGYSGLDSDGLVVIVEDSDLGV